MCAMPSLSAAVTTCGLGATPNSEAHQTMAHRRSADVGLTAITGRKSAHSGTSPVVKPTQPFARSTSHLCSRLIFGNLSSCSSVAQIDSPTFLTLSRNRSRSSFRR